MQGRPNFQRDPPNFYPRLPTPQKPKIYQRPQPVDRSGPNRLGAPDKGWGPRQPLSSKHSQFDQGSNRRGGGDLWDRSLLGRQVPSNLPPKQALPKPDLDSAREYALDEAAEEMSARFSSAQEDTPLPEGVSRFTVHNEKERRRKEYEHNEGRKLGKERQLQRQVAIQQIAKGVAKLPQIKKTRDIFLSKHVSVQHLARLLGVKMGQHRACVQRGLVLIPL